jgi:tetratricopeptide (TPR) repeat protein
MAAETVQWAQLLATNSPTQQNWTAALQVLRATSPADQKLRLDLLRLMALTNALTTKEDYLQYVDAADPRVMSNEVSRVLAAGTAANLLKTTDPEYVEAKRVVDQRSAQDRADAPRLMAAAERGTAADALNAGDVAYSLAQYSDAEKMYALAVQKGGAERDTALTRLGIAQAQQGKSAEAKATFAQITSGPRAPLARMWEAYVQTKARG